jgi:hypothetical protein
MLERTVQNAVHSALHFLKQAYKSPNLHCPFPHVATSIDLIQAAPSDPVHISEGLGLQSFSDTTTSIKLLCRKLLRLLDSTKGTNNPTATGRAGPGRRLRLGWHRPFCLYVVLWIYMRDGEKFAMDRMHKSSGHDRKKRRGPAEMTRGSAKEKGTNIIFIPWCLHAATHSAAVASWPRRTTRLHEPAPIFVRRQRHWKKKKLVVTSQ